MNLDLSGRAAIVTGAGRGIGRAVTLKLAENGAAVVANDLDAEPLSETAALAEQRGGRVKALAGDITGAGFPDAIARAAVEEFGSIDIIVNNAGFTWDSVIQKTTDEQFQAMLDIHIVAPFRLLRAASEWIRAAARREVAEGRRVMRKVVNVTSISGVDGIAGQAGYGSGKAGIIGLTKVLAKEWGRYNVNVNAVGFGFIETRLTQALGTEAAQIDVGGRKIKVGVPAEAMEAIRRQCPLGRLGTVEEAAGAVLFLCSALSDYVTGEVLMCSGGARV
ncbi:MAG TPA: SDR family oxidoreductase [Bryobacteraceae bacterium]|nr:SDR family oxidoreductase [Bryobacteraceae bacterium]